MTQAAAAALPRAKNAGDENFPVGSLLIAPALRPHVMAFYRFARHADDVADSPSLSPEEKLDQLEVLGAGLRGEAPVGAGPGLALRAAMSGSPVGTQHALDLLEAFKRDAVGIQCWSWLDLMTYCRFSAAPVGRFLLALHGEDEAAHHASDALCAALQVLNHVQDCREDWRLLRRSYIPRSWLLGAGITAESLDNSKCCPDIRGVLDLTLDGIDDLLRTAATLPGQVRSRRLRLEAAVILQLAFLLSAKLRRRDPLARKVRLTPVQTFGGFALGIVRGLRAA